MTRSRIGLLMPTFGRQAGRDRILTTAREAERYGFHSLWVRDHLFVPPGRVHGGIVENGVHLEAVIALAMIGAITSTITLGTAILTPTRHPLRLAQELATVAYLAGDRLVVGLGAGAYREEFDALALDFGARQRLLEETVAVLRLLERGEPVSHQGAAYRFENAAILPPLGRPTLWYGGSGSLTSVRTAVASGYDGWFGLTPADIFPSRIALLRELSAAAGRHMTVASIPQTSIARTREAALACIDQRKVIDAARSGGQRPDYRTFDEVKSALILGTPDEAVAQLRALEAAGVDEIVLDLRLVGDAFDDVFHLIASEVLPAFSG